MSTVPASGCNRTGGSVLAAKVAHSLAATDSSMAVGPPSSSGRGAERSLPPGAGRRKLVQRGGGRKEKPRRCEGPGGSSGVGRKRQPGQLVVVALGLLLVAVRRSPGGQRGPANWNPADGPVAPRWHFVGPLVIDGVACNRRVAELYLLAGVHDGHTPHAGLAHG